MMDEISTNSTDSQLPPANASGQNLLMMEKSLRNSTTSQLPLADESGQNRLMTEKSLRNYTNSQLPPVGESGQKISMMDESSANLTVTEAIERGQNHQSRRYNSQHHGFSNLHREAGVNVKVRCKNPKSANCKEIERVIHKHVEEFQDHRNVLHCQLTDYFKKKRLTFKGITKGCILLHLSTHCHKALRSLSDVYVQKDIMKTLAEILLIEDLREEFLQEWSMCIDKEKYDAALFELESCYSQQPSAGESGQTISVMEMNQRTSTDSQLPPATESEKMLMVEKNPVQCAELKYEEFLEAVDDVTRPFEREDSQQPIAGESGQTISVMEINPGTSIYLQLPPATESGQNLSTIKEITVQSEDMTIREYLLNLEKKLCCNAVRFTPAIYSKKKAYQKDIDDLFTDLEKKEKEPIFVLSVAGVFRTGKSTHLRNLADNWTTKESLGKLVYKDTLQNAYKTRDLLDVLDNSSLAGPCDQEISDDQYYELLRDISEWYDENGSIDMLRVLYRDHLAYDTLQNASKTRDLLDVLHDSGYLSPTDLIILYDTINLTKQFGFKPKNKKLLPLFQNVRNVEISKFTAHRQNIVKLGMTLIQEDVATLDGSFNMRRKKYEDSWHLIKDLEHRMVICEGQLNAFINKLSELQLHLAVEALTEGTPSKSSSLVRRYSGVLSFSRICPDSFVQERNNVVCTWRFESLVHKKELPLKLGFEYKDFTHFKIDIVAPHISCIRIKGPTECNFLYERSYESFNCLMHKKNLQRRQQMVELALKIQKMCELPLKMGFEYEDVTHFKVGFVTCTAPHNACIQVKSNRFNADYIRKYIRKHFYYIREPALGDSLIKELQLHSEQWGYKHPEVYSMCQNQVFLFSVCTLWEDRQHLPSDKADLYKELFRCILNQFIKEEATDHMIIQFKDTPEKFIHAMLILGKRMYESLKRNKLLLYKKDLQGSQQI